MIGRGIGTVRTRQSVLVGLCVLAGCGETPAPDATGAASSDPGFEVPAERPGSELEGTADEASLPEEQELFWSRLQALCGEAFAGSVSDATPYYEDGVVDTEMVMHVMTCDEDRIHIPFHIDDNRSRSWILTRVDGTIRLKHDHRNVDGSEETISQYGGNARRPGLPTRQIFPADQHTATILPDRADNFWFLDFVDDETLQYGVHWPGLGHSVRVEFDLSEPIDPPTAPWGY